MPLDEFVAEVMQTLQTEGEVKECASNALAGRR
jgi:hypothetical protein